MSKPRILAGHMGKTLRRKKCILPGLTELPQTHSTPGLMGNNLPILIIVGRMGILHTRTIAGHTALHPTFTLVGLMDMRQVTITQNVSHDIQHSLRLTFRIVIRYFLQCSSLNLPAQSC